jgi:DNA-binding response OmpR family regulator
VGAGQAQHLGQVLSQEQLLQRVWGWDDDQSGNVVKVYVDTLRQKIEADPRRPGYVVTRRGFGYAFIAPPAPGPLAPPAPGAPP